MKQRSCVGHSTSLRAFASLYFSTRNHAQAESPDEKVDLESAADRNGDVEFEIREPEATPKEVDVVRESSRRDPNGTLLVLPRIRLTL